MKIEVKTLAAKDAGAIDLDDAVFGIEEVRSDLLQRVVKWQLAARQQGTHKTLGRSEINRTKKVGNKDIQTICNDNSLLLLTSHFQQ